MKEKTTKIRKAAATILFAIMISASSFAIPSIATESGEIKQTIFAGEYKITEDTGVHQIQMLTPGYHILDSPGNPALPEKILEFKVPTNIDWTTLKLIIENQKLVPLTGSYDINPCPPEILQYNEDETIVEWGYSKSIVDGRNTYIYGTDADYPAQSIEMLPYTERQEPSDSGFENAKYARIAYRPFMYNPVRQQLTLIESATILLTYECSSRKEIIPLSDTTYDFVIITTNDIVANSEKLDNFIALKEFEGYDVLVVTEDEYGVLPGAETADKIRKWLQENDDPLGINYVLLIGDPNPDDPSDDWVDIPADPTDHVGDIPMKMTWISYAGWQTWHDPAYHGYPTDMYYADLTGDWDLDNDGLYGEDIPDTNPASPWPGNPKFDDGTYSVIWTGFLHIPFGTTYRFHTLSDDGVRLTIDGTTVFDELGAKDWPINEFSHSPGNSGDLWLAADWYDITLEYDNHGGDGIICLWWQTPTLPEGTPHYVDEIIPKTHLYDSGNASDGLDGIYYGDSNFGTIDNMRKDETINFVWATGDIGTDGVDYGAENYIGRIPVYDNDYDQLDYILDKIIKYETDQGDISWRNSTLLAMAPLTDTTPAYHYGEEVMADITGPAGFDHYRIYWDNYSSVGGPIPDEHPTEVWRVRNAWQNGYGLVTWWTHGSSQSAQHIFNNDSVADLDDSKPSFVYQATCLNGYPENDYNLGYALLRNGAIATVSATRVSSGSRGNWTYDSTSSANPNWGYKYIQHIITDEYTAGQALYDAKGTVHGISRNLMNYNLYGEPTIKFFDIIENSPPTADPGGPYTVDEGSSVTLDASGSSDPENEPLTFEWDLDDDGEYDDATGVTTSYDGIDDGIYTIGLRVSDGIFDVTSSTTVTVENVAPTITPFGPFTVDENTSLTITADSTDPGSDDLTFNWDWDDGTTTTTIYYNDGISPDPYPSPWGTYPFSASDTVTHTYGDNGVFNLNLTVTDDDNGNTSYTTTITVNNVDPTATIDNMSLPYPDNPDFILPIVHTLTFNATASDPGSDDLTFNWDWDDGTTNTTTYYNDGIAPDPYPSPDVNPITITDTQDHIYMTNGTFNITLTVIDDDGGTTTDTWTVKVLNIEEAKHDINNYTQNNVSDILFKPKAEKRKGAFNNMFNALDDMLADEEYWGMIQHLENNIREKCDGYIDGKKGDDWILGGTTDGYHAQWHICHKIDDLTAYIATFL